MHNIAKFINYCKKTKNIITIIIVTVNIYQKGKLLMENISFLIFMFGYYIWIMPSIIFEYILAIFHIYGISDYTTANFLGIIGVIALIFGLFKSKKTLSYALIIIGVWFLIFPFMYYYHYYFVV